jgi:hypothetical protein
MAATVIGNNLTTAVEAKKSRRVRASNDGTSIIVSYTQKQGTAVTVALGASCTLTGYTALVLNEYALLPDPGGGYETLELTYGPSTPASGVTPPVGTVIQEADTNTIEIPIEQHPDFSAGQSVYDENGVLVTPYVGALKPGVTSYLLASPTYTRTEIAASFTFSEANIVAAVGTRSTPTGMTSPTANKWLKTRLGVRKTGSVVEKSETWQYAGPGTRVWDTDIYP